MPLFVFFFLFFSTLCASPLIVSDPTNDASNATMIGKLVEQITKYEEMIQKANDQVQRLNQINDVMNKTHQFLNGSAIAIASPSEVVANLKHVLATMQYNAKSLKDTLKNFDIGSKIRIKEMGNKCPWLRYDIISPQSLKIFFTETGEETQLLKDAKKLVQTLSDDVYSNLHTTLGTLSGRALAESLCEVVLKEELEQQKKIYQEKEKAALIRGDMSEYSRLRNKRLKAELTKILDDQAQLSKKFSPLIGRQTQMLEQLGVKDPSANTKEMQYCQEGSNQEGAFCYPQALETQRLNQEFDGLQKEFHRQLLLAGNSTQAQANAYANFNQKGQILLLHYAKEMANHLAFVNETLSLIGSLMAEDFQRKYYRNLNLQDKSTKEQKTEREIKDLLKDKKMFDQYSSNFDNYGFPLLR